MVKQERPKVARTGHDVQQGLADDKGTSERKLE